MGISFLNHNSALLLALALGLLILWAIWEYRRSAKALLFISVAVLIVTVGYTQLKTEGNSSASVQSIAAIDEERPIFLEVFSNT